MTDVASLLPAGDSLCFGHVAVATGGTGTDFQTTNNGTEILLSIFFFSVAKYYKNKTQVLKSFISLILSSFKIKKDSG